MEDALNTSVLLASRIHVNSIRQRAPFSHSSNSSNLLLLSWAILGIDNIESTFQSIPGVFLWTLLVGATAGAKGG